MTFRRNVLDQFPILTSRLAPLDAVFMTGTPRLFTTGSKAKFKGVKEDGGDEIMAIRSMDNEG